ncbi:MAG: BtrH N-terminal domain-containing protein [Tannerellaceae bacterium]|jgi:hypothetical protein|nr:BtrH N-terminal domain-containing protein [Tannerellaceae bacterium]
MKINFEHSLAAHCESGVTTSMLRHYGVQISEPLALGIGAGVFFSYMPFIKLHDMPVVSFRPLPGHIFARVTRRLGVSISSRRFLNQDKAMRALDRLLEKGIPTGAIVGVFYLPYFPKEYRFHFNAHNICIIGKEGDVYTVSDPVSVVTNEISSADLKRVRFAKGTWPPMGKMYWVKHVRSQTPDLKPAILSGILLNCRRMLDIPLPFFGVKGISMLASQMREWESKLGARKAALQLAQVIRMLEEIGTGGAGFRYMYAAFLQEASVILGKESLLNGYASRMTMIGDAWRDFAFESARKFKKRGDDVCSYDGLADKLSNIANLERSFFADLREAVKKL